MTPTETRAAFLTKTLHHVIDEVHVVKIRAQQLLDTCDAIEKALIEAIAYAADVPPEKDGTQLAELIAKHPRMIVGKTYVPADPPGRTTEITSPRGLLDHVDAKIREKKGADLAETVRRGKGHHKVLAAIVQTGSRGATIALVSVVTGYRTTQRAKYLGELEDVGWILQSGDRYFSTEEGAQICGPVEKRPTGAKLVEWWKRELSGGPLAAFVAIESAGADGYDLDEIMAETGYKATVTREHVNELLARELVTKEAFGDGPVYRLSAELRS